MSRSNPEPQNTTSSQTGKGSAVLFSGYPAPTSNTTYVPNQFLDVVLRRASRGAVRLVGYMLRRILGWSNPDGSPQETQVRFSYTDLTQGANISNGAIREAIDEALKARYIVCIEQGQCNASGVLGKSATYELNWDESDEYITEPERFCGFFAGNGNRTYIPNAFFDHTIRNEPLAVAKVVGAIVRHTIAFQDRYGFRRTQKALSFDDLLRITRLNSRSTLNDAIKIALSHCHILRLETGTFGNGGVHKSTYSLRWEDTAGTAPETSSVEPSPKPPKGGTVQNPNLQNQGFPLVSESRPQTNGPKSEPRNTPKSEPRTVQNPNQERAKNRTSLEITKNNTLKEQQQKVLAAPTQSDIATEVAVVVFSATSLLKNEGFLDKDAITIVQTKLREIRTQLLEENVAAEEAELTAAKRTETLIQNQIAWLSKRAVKKSKLGMLRTAIEEDFTNPEGNLPQASKLGTAFARSYYAAYTGTEVANAQPYARDPELAAEFFTSLKLPDDQAETVGASFGRFVKDRHASDRSAKPFLSTAVKSFANDFRKVLTARSTRKVDQQRAAVRQQHEEKFKEAHYEYLKERANELEKYPKLFEEFEQERSDQAAAMRKLGLDPRKYFTKEERISSVADYFKTHKQFKVLSFWEWDQQINPLGLRFTTQGPTAHIQNQAA